MMPDWKSDLMGREPSESPHEGPAPDLLAPAPDGGGADAAATAPYPLQCFTCDNRVEPHQLVDLDGLLLCPECVTDLFLYRTDRTEEGGLWE
jgi:hypothetical protein